MKKLIIKTSIITLALILIFGIGLYGLLGYLYPSSIASIAFRVNNKSVCLKYSEKQYEKTNDISDLAILIERAIWAKDNQLIVKYSALFLNSSDFENYKKDKNGYENFIVCYYTEALYLTNKKEKAIEIAFSYYNGKSELNPVRVLVLSSKNDDAMLNKILKKLNSIENKTQETINLINQINNLKGA